MQPKQKLFEDITRKGSKTFYSVSLFFPKEIRHDVFLLYAFTRTADDLVDAIPPNTQKFQEYKQLTGSALDGNTVDHPVVDAFGELVRRKSINKNLVWDYFTALDMDVDGRKYRSYQNLEVYMYGVAETIGLMMAKIMEVPEESYQSARLLGKAFQLINIIRDIDEDQKAGRVYIPQDDLRRFGLTSVREGKAQEQKMKELIRFELERFFEANKEAKKGLRFLPRNYRVPIATASDVFQFVGKKIYDDPMIVFRTKVKPSVIQILLTVFRNAVFLGE